jgi:hypothetical protein
MAPEMVGQMLALGNTSIHLSARGRTHFDDLLSSTTQSVNARIRTYSRSILLPALQNFT